MTLKRYLLSMSLATAIAWAAWAMVLVLVSPEEVGMGGVLLFFVSLFLALIGTFSLVGLALRFLLLKKEMVYYQVVNSFRQAALLAILIDLSLVLQSFGLLTWWNFLLFVVGLGILELFFLQDQTQYDET